MQLDLSPFKIRYLNSSEQFDIIRQHLNQHFQGEIYECGKGGVV